MTSIREELDRKLNNLSPEQLDSVRQFVESLEHQPTPADPGNTRPQLQWRNPDDPNSRNQLQWRDSNSGNLNPPTSQNYPLTNEDIDRIVESYRQQNKPLPIGLAKGEFIVPDDFNDPLPDEILDLFNNPA